MRTGSHRWRHATRANAAVEFALVMPLLMLIMGGVVEFGLLFKVYNGANRIASHYASAWSDCTDVPIGTCLTELGRYTAPATISNLVPQLQPANVTLQMFQVQMAGTTPVVTYAYPSLSTLTAAQITAARAAFSSGQRGVLVTFTYQHSLNIFSGSMTPYLASYLQPSYTVTQLKS